jgi:ATP-binding cassette subfamily F protein 3
VLNQVDLLIAPGTRLGLLGRNGAGKSTLIKLLAGVLPPRCGRWEAGQGLVTGYFAQHQLEQLRPDWSPLQHLQRLDARATEQALRDFLGGFDFRGDQALAPVEPFSGGEKARLALALLVWQRPNLLLLDEPTNHLDLDMRHALNLALQDYAGALIVVSHDRQLLRSTADGFLRVAGGRVQPFDGDLEDYCTWLDADQRSGRAAAGGQSGATARREQRRMEAEQRQERALKRRPLEKQVRALETQIDRLTAEKAELETALVAPELYASESKPRLQALLRLQGRVAAELEQAESEWLAVQEALEDLAAAGD